MSGIAKTEYDRYGFDFLQKHQIYKRSDNEMKNRTDQNGMLKFSITFVLLLTICFISLQKTSFCDEYLVGLLFEQTGPNQWETVDRIINGVSLDGNPNDGVIDYKKFADRDFSYDFGSDATVIIKHTINMSGENGVNGVDGDTHPINQITVLMAPQELMVKTGIPLVYQQELLNLIPVI